MTRISVKRSRLVSWIAIAVVAASLAVLSFCASVGEVFASANPALAQTIGVGDRAQARLSYLLAMSAAGKIKPTDVRLRSAAKEAIAAQPLNTMALESIAMYELQAGHNDASVRFARLTETLSRRQLGAQVLLFRASLLKNDLRGAFAQLDAAMRTAGDRRTVLFPVMTQGLKIPEFRKGLVPIVDQRREWAPQFLIYAVDEGGAAVDVAEFFSALDRRTRAFLAGPLAGRTITRLTNANQVELARKMYLSLPGKSADMLSNPGLNAATLDPAIGTLGWTFEQGPTLTARLAEGDSPGSRAVLINVGPGESSPALSRILFITPGKYVFSASSRTDGTSTKISSQWSIRCVGGARGRELWNSGEGSVVSIPPDCPSQLMRLVVTQQDGSNYGQLLVTGVALTRR
jgi:hypothetical protein